MPFNSTSSLKGFVRNSTAPAFIACTLIGTSPCPVMKMIGISVLSASCCCNSRPVSPGSVTSSTKQHGTIARGRERNSFADANVSGCQPAVLINNSSDSRTETSSSTTKTMDVTSGIFTSIDRWRSPDSQYMARDRSCRCSWSSCLPHPKRGVERVVQRRLAERLEQALHCALREQTRTDRLVSVGGDEHNRDVPLAADQFLLQFGARHARHRDVEEQTARLADEIGREERFGR